MVCMILNGKAGLSGHDLTGRDLTGCDLTGRDLTGCDLNRYSIVSTFFKQGNPRAVCVCGGGGGGGCGGVSV